MNFFNRFSSSHHYKQLCHLKNLQFFSRDIFSFSENVTTQIPVQSIAQNKIGIQQQVKLLYKIISESPT
ncbi:CLUMA_CG018618, isoform A [Clunio marinus]|uniref:CLUMA_CG018618, isoform A n=1 Tax=Clunio marinus TaxID=568069 RepID=A0A1J1IY78_9DIPT|nr:CLUMA_CG018618, isoform A [Clunio marinus]